jgi:hypothetical protein
MEFCEDGKETWCSIRMKNFHSGGVNCWGMFLYANGVLLLAMGIELEMRG